MLGDPLVEPNTPNWKTGNVYPISWSLEVNKEENSLDVSSVSQLTSREAPRHTDQYYCIKPLLSSLYNPAMLPL